MGFAYVLAKKINKPFRLENHFEWMRREVRSGNWKEVPFDQYCREFPIPQFITDKVAELREKLPTAVFKVEYYYNDPFVVVSHRANTKNGCTYERYYVYVWNEKSFKVPNHEQKLE